MKEIDELYTMAREVLLDALTALGDHRSSIVLVGAQAIYLRVGDADLAVSPFTTDSDLVINPSILTKIPPIEQVLMNAGFHPKNNQSVGIWITKRLTRHRVSTEIPVDLLVPASLAPGVGRRAARLLGHDLRAARIAHGLSGVVVDSDIMEVRALDAHDARAIDVHVAGPAALLVAKLHKISDRQGTNRQSDKDALDVLRLLRGTTTDILAARYELLLADSRSREEAKSGCLLLKAQFTTPSAIGIQMASRSAGIANDTAEIAASCEALALDLLEALAQQS